MDNHGRYNSQTFEKISYLVGDVPRRIGNAHQRVVGYPSKKSAVQFNPTVYGLSPHPSPNPRQYKKRDRKHPGICEQVQEVEEGARLNRHRSISGALGTAKKRRIQPTLVPRQPTPGNLELHRSYAIGPDYKRLEQEWHERRQQTESATAGISCTTKRISRNYNGR